MSSKILIKRSTTTGAIPTTADLDTGEFAVNTVDKRLFTNNQGTIVEIGTTPSTQAVAGNATVGGTFAVTGATTLSTGSTTGNFSVAGTLQLDTEGTASNHVVTKAYVDTAISDLVDGAGSALDTLKELADAINNDANFATTITNSIATKLTKSGDTMTGNLNMGSNKVTTTANPTADDDLTRKGYVDTILGSATAAATSASEAATSAANAATSESNAAASATSASSSATSASSSASSASASATSASTSASSASTSATQASTSATNAATSATNAENAFDSFDDRYLGAKASDPTVDNDGDALITGAMYFDSTNDVMKVYNGSEWQNASSSIEGIKADFQYTATASQTVFSGADDNASTLVIDKAELTNVYLNGVRLATTDYTVTPATNTVTLATGASVGDIVEIEVFGNFAGQSGAEVAITGGSITGLTELSTGTFTSTGIDDNATSTAITIDASGNLLVGKTNDLFATSGTYLGASGVVEMTADGSSPLRINRKTSDGEIIRLAKDGTTVGSIGVDATRSYFDGNSASGIRFGGVDVSPRLNGSNSNGSVDLGWSGGRFKDLYLSGGVVFGDAGGSGSSSSNTLDSYEEGTWTPVVAASGTNPTMTVSSVSTGGRYTKVGNRVTVSFEVRWSSVSGGSGSVVIEGLPFSRINTVVPDADHSTFSFYGVSVATNTVSAVMTISNNATSIGLDFTRSDATTIPLSPSNLGLAGSLGFIRGSITYETNS